SRPAEGRRQTGLVTEPSDDGHRLDIGAGDGAPDAVDARRPDLGGASRMHRFSRLLGLAGLLATLVAGLIAGPVAAAGSATAGHGSPVYVANGGAGGSNYTGFRLNAGGRLRPIPGSTYALPDNALPGHILISPDGRRLVGTRVGPNAGPSYLDAFAISRNGRLTPAPGSPFAAQRIGPFGSTFSPVHGDQLFVSNAPDGDHLYVVDAGVAKVSAFSVDGTTITEQAGSPVAIPGGAAPFGMVVD